MLSSSTRRVRRVLAQRCSLSQLSRQRPLLRRAAEPARRRRPPGECCTVPKDGREPTRTYSGAPAGSRCRCHRAAGVVRALAAPGVYLEFVVESAGTMEAFERWLDDVLEGHLFAHGRSGISERYPRS